MTTTTPPKRGRPRNGTALAHDRRAVHLRVKTARRAFIELMWRLNGADDVMRELKVRAPSGLSWVINNYQVVTHCLDALDLALTDARRADRD